MMIDDSPKGVMTRHKQQELSKDNKVRRRKQTELHTLGSRSMAQTADSIAKKKGRQLERGKMYEVAYSHREGTVVNATTGANIPDNAFGQVIGAKRGGRVRGVGFGPTPSSNRARSMDDSTPPPTSIAIDQTVIKLSTQVEAMKEKCARYEVEMRLMRWMLTSLCPSFPSDWSGDLIPTFKMLQFEALEKKRRDRNFDPIPTLSGAIPAVLKTLE
ncbi:hypothetical protein SO802_028732 [Lithocarpus litseifolius]|uniref:Uncharacterized protein n=1 Tax=Lithocarpus litseifolius TaxID=425828 RepID=A0AAW2BS35_9ROSI